MDNETESSNTSILTAAVERIVEKLKLERVRDMTWQNYYTVWKSFNSFFIKLDIKPNNWEDRLTLFVGYLVGKRRKSNTIRSYISAI